MRVKAAMIVFLAAPAAGCGSRRSADISKPEAFARQVAVQPGGGGGKLQRLTLLPAALTVSKRRGVGDTRLFDARGRLAGMALLACADEAATSVDLPVYPVPARPNKVPVFPAASLDLLVVGSGTVAY